MTQASGDLRKVEEDQDCTDTREQATLLTRLQSMLLAVSRFFASHYWILCVLIGGVALAFNLFRLGSKSLWFDEVLSVERARQSDQPRQACASAPGGQDAQLRLRQTDFRRAVR